MMHHDVSRFNFLKLNKNDRNYSTILSSSTCLFYKLYVLLLETTGKYHLFVNKIKN